MTQNTRFSKFSGSQPLCFICSVRFLFAAFRLSAVYIFYLQRSFLFAAYFFLFAGYFFYLQRTLLFAAYFFYLQRFFFVCSVLLLFAAYIFYLQRSFFVCSVSFLFAAYFFYLQRSFFVCSVSLVGHRSTITRSLRSLVRYQVEHSKRNSISLRTHALCSIL